MNPEFSSETRFRLRSEEIIHDAFESEVVLIDLASGSYFSLERSGTHIWNGLCRGATLGQIQRELGALYAADPGVLSTAVHGLTGELLEAGLIEIDEHNGTDAAEEPVSDAPRPMDANPGPFIAPRLKEFTDMQDLIQLDPIHEVDNLGWPNAKRH